jgi:membrane complex biogenesis BtpA family protein
MVSMEPQGFFSQLHQPIIGMIHLRPLPGAAAYRGGGSGPALELALADGRLLDAAGVDAIMIQNTGDLPALTDGGPETIAHMAAIGAVLRQELKAPLGVNILANGTESALAVAAAIGARFVRIKVYVGAVVGIGGLIQGSAQRAQDFMGRIDARHIEVAADVYDRTSRPLGDMSIEEVARYASFHGGARALVVTGGSVDESLDRLRRVKAAVTAVPVYTGGGTTKDNLGQFLAVCDGVIVGNAVKVGPEFQGRVDYDRLMAYMDAARRARG